MLLHIPMRCSRIPSAALLFGFIAACAAEAPPVEETAIKATAAAAVEATVEVAVAATVEALADEGQNALIVLVFRDTNFARRLGIRSTPTFYLNGVWFQGA